MTRSLAPTALTPLLHGPTLARVLGLIGTGRAAAFLGQFQADLGSALQMLRATSAMSDQQATQRTVHSLIGLAGTVAASELEEAARCLHLALQTGDDPKQGALLAKVANLTERLMTELSDWRASGGNVADGNDK